MNTNGEARQVSQVDPRTNEHGATHPDGPSPSSHGRPRILDLFCCQGGAGMGYHRAGFDVVGVDIEWQERYPFPMTQADALHVLRTLPLGHGNYAAIHASPPCQAYSATQRIQGNDHPDLIAALRRELERTGLPYVIENVCEAYAWLKDPIMLCGTMFGLPLYRHRLFEFGGGFDCDEPLHGYHHLKQVKMGRKPGPGEVIQVVGNFSGVDIARDAMEMPWATRDGLREAIPPAYTEYVGKYLLAHVQQFARGEPLPDEAKTPDEAKAA